MNREQIIREVANYLRPYDAKAADLALEVINSEPTPLEIDKEGELLLEWAITNKFPISEEGSKSKRDGARWMAYYLGDVIDELKKNKHIPQPLPNTVLPQVNKLNYGIMVEENKSYPAIYTVMQNGLKVFYPQYLKGKDLTEKQIKYLYEIGYFNYDQQQVREEVSAEDIKLIEGKWKIVGHSHQIADTGDYDGCWEITDGTTSIFTAPDDEQELLYPIVNALNESGLHFYTNDEKEYIFHLEQQLQSHPVNTGDGCKIEEWGYTEHFIEWRNKFFIKDVKVLEYKSMRKSDRYSVGELHEKYSKAMLQSPFKVSYPPLPPVQ